MKMESYYVFHNQLRDMERGYRTDYDIVQMDLYDDRRNLISVATWNRSKRSFSMSMIDFPKLRCHRIETERILSLNGRLFTLFRVFRSMEDSSPLTLILSPFEDVVEV